LQIPPELRTALESEAASVPQSSIVSAAKRISDNYRQGEPTGTLTSVEALAYSLVRMPATYGAAVSALAFAPAAHSLLDLGAGPGTFGWAAVTCQEGMEQITFVEHDRALMDLGKNVAGHSKAPALRDASWQVADLKNPGEFPPHDIVTLSYSLAELGRFGILESAWKAARLALIVIEAGSPRGFVTVRAARARLIELGGSITAPCPHNNACPMPDNDWCHFAARVERTALHRRLKGGELSYEDEKFSYIVATPTYLEQAEARIIRRPDISPGLIQLTLCGQTGLSSAKVRKRDGDAWRMARKASWGDSWSLPVPGPKPQSQNLKNR
jgi:ribosomal protein RSM22 (predicted rRNA methylase)